MEAAAAASAGTTRVGKYEIGRTLGEGSFGKVKHAVHGDSGRPFAVKILERHRILALKFAGQKQLQREIATLRLLKHPNVVQLHEVLASKTKIYMVLEYVHGGDLHVKLRSNGKLSEPEGRKLFQQLIDAIGYCHEKGVYHRDLKPENLLIDKKGNLKVSDFGLSTLHEDVCNDGLFHTTCGSPNYVAPEVLANKGYHGSKSDIWSCGVILFVVLSGHLPFQDMNMVVLYQKIFRGNARIPKTLSDGATDIIRRILDPNPATRIGVDGIKSHEWFKQDYVPAAPIDDDDDAAATEDLGFIDGHAVKELPQQRDEDGERPNLINAFQLISMSSSLELSGLFEEEGISERTMRFTWNFSSKDLYEMIESVFIEMGFHVQLSKGNGKLKATQRISVSSSPGSPRSSLTVAAEIFELNPSLYIVEVRKSNGDLSVYRQLCAKLTEVLGVWESRSTS